MYAPLRPGTFRDHIGNPATRLSQARGHATGRKYRPMGIGRFEAALDSDGWPLGINKRTNSDRYDRGSVPSGTYNNMVSKNAVQGLSELPYLFPARYYDYHTQNFHVPVGFRRSTGSGMNAFYLESFVDELAYAAGNDPYEYRRELIARNTTFRNRNDRVKALDMVAEMAGWGKPLPEGWARGIAIDDRRRAQPTPLPCFAAPISGHGEQSSISTTTSPGPRWMSRTSRRSQAWRHDRRCRNPFLPVRDSGRCQAEGRGAWLLKPNQP
jgi:hypothetical protein